MHAHIAVEPKLPRSIEDLIETLQSGMSVDPMDARDLLMGLDTDISELAPWQDFDHPVRDSYGRILLGRGDNFELMLMSWTPGDYSAIHDHGAARCAISARRITFSFPKTDVCSPSPSE